MAEKLFRANWQVSGVGKKDLKEGDTVKVEETQVTDLVKLGALSPADAKATPPEGGGE